MVPDMKLHRGGNAGIQRHITAVVREVRGDGEQIHPEATNHTKKNTRG
jgi:hypothetical protein